MNLTDLPRTNTPNSVMRLVDNNGRWIKERTFGSDGRANLDVHFSHHGNEKTHPHAPHWHSLELVYRTRGTG